MSEFQPVTISESGKNAFYIASCDAVEHSPAYCSCLDKIKRLKEKQSIPNECASAIRHGHCKAADMRQEEELKGQALYFTPRSTPVIADAPNWNRYTPTTKAKRRSATVVFDNSASGTYADAINAAIKTLPKPAVPMPTMVVGETPLQFARRLAVTALLKEIS